MSGRGQGGGGGGGRTSPPGQGSAALRSSLRGSHVGKKVASLQVLKVDADGSGRVILLGKHQISMALQLPVRDLRMLDPQLATTFPAALLVRENAIVVNLEGVRAVITVDHILLFSHTGPKVTAFVTNLQQKLSQRRRKGFRGGVESEEEDAVGDSYSPPGADSAAVQMLRSPGKRNYSEEDLPEVGVPQLPFELHCLELVLQHVCSSLMEQATDLDRVLVPALEALVVRITMKNLEKIRKAKIVLNRLTKRTEQIREEMENFLNDDGDMRDLYLTRKLDIRQRKSQEEVEAAAAREAEVEAAAEESNISGLFRTPRSIEIQGRNVRDGQGQDGHDSTRRGVFSASPRVGSHRKIGDLQSFYERDVGYDSDEDIQEAENLLEAYFIIVDNTYDKLTTMSENIDDTEDYVNIALDTLRNKLIQIDLVFTTGTFGVAVAALIASIFGMNIKNGIEGSEPLFISVTVILCLGVIIFFIILIWYYRRNRLVNI